MTTQQETILSAERVKSAVAKFNDTDRGIAELEENYGDVIYDVDTVEGMKAAKRARKRIRDPRYMVESLRKEAKAPILELGRKLDEKAKRLTGRLLAIEVPIDDQIKAEEKRVEEAKRIEEERIAGHRERIERMREATHELLRFDPTPTPSKVQRVLDRVRAVDPSEFQEFTAEAIEARESAQSQLESALKAAERREQEQAELAALRREKAEREAAEKVERQRAERQRVPLFTTSGDPPELNVPYEAIPTEPPAAYEPAPWDEEEPPEWCESCGELPAYTFSGEASLCPACFSDEAKAALVEAGLGEFCCRLLRIDGIDSHYLCLTLGKSHGHDDTGSLVEC